MPQTPSTRPATPNDGSGGVTRRAVLVALVLLILLSIVDFYIEMVWGAGDWTFASGVPTVVPVVALFVLTALMGMPLLRRAGLSRRELLVVYCMLLVGIPVVSHGVLAWMLVKTIAYHYGARAQPHWETMFIQYVPTWWAPSGEAAVEGFFNGDASVPWAEWTTPLAAWSSFAFALFIATLCLMSLVQRQWITNERLTFPIAQIPLETVPARHTREPGARGRLAASWTFWLGLFIALALTFMSTLSTKWPALPNLPLFIYDIIPWQRVGPLAGLGGLTLVFWPWMLSLAYLIPNDLSFSLWFFTIVRLLLTVAAIAAGATPQRPEGWWDSSFPAPCFQGTGAVLALTVWVLWIARRHLGRALRIALSRRPASEDAREPLGYRLAFVGLIASVAYLVYFLWVAGSRVWVGLALMSLTIAYFAAWARLRAENGMSFICFPYHVQDVLSIPFSNAAFRPAESVAFITLRWAYTPGFSASSEIFPGGVLDSFKIADAAGVNPRRLARALILAFAFTWVLGLFITLTGMYRYGWFGLAASRGGWLGPQSIGDGNTIVSRLTTIGEPDVRGVVAVLAGAVVTVALGVMRLRFWWWPLHPVGYLASNTWGAQWWFLPFFIGWAAKVLVVRYGGLRLYRITLPFAIGLIVGDLLNTGIWAAVTLITQGRI
ncbi:MAG: hypothetical protein JSV79_00835 [Armatimonadota bacterium]|nr:MAG: hypothetical protein JSV79_00835 [Armatimonadota bacterium]